MKAFSVALRVVVAALMLAVLLPANTPAAPVAPNVALAKAHFKRATALYRQGRYREAITEFEATYRAKPHGVLHFNIAQCYEKLGEIPAALQSYHEYLRELPKAEDRAEVLATMSNLEKRLAATGVQQLLVYSDPSDAEVWINGVLRGRTPLSTLLAHGTHSVSVVKPGYRTLTRETVLAPDRSVELDLALQPGASTPPPVPAPPPTAPMPVATAPAPLTSGATAAPPAVDLKPTWAPSTIPPLSLIEPPTPRVRKSRTWTWVAAGAAAVAVGAATYYSLSAQSSSNQLTDGKVRTQAQVQSLHDGAQSQARTANALWVIGGVAGAAGVTLFFVEGSF
jgi:tetratricopeptide (TPR) repeat protein